MRRVSLALFRWRGSRLRPASHAPRPPPTSSAALADLAGDDADKREAAVAVLGQTGDPKWLEFLGALRDGSVYARKKAEDGRARRGRRQDHQGRPGRHRDRDRLRAAPPLGTVPLADLVEVAADRRLRIAIKPFLDADETRGQFASPDPDVRRGAAIKLGNQADAGAAPASRRRSARKRIRGCATRWPRRWR